MKRLKLLILTFLLGWLAAAPLGFAQPDVQYARFDINITVLANGRFIVQEVQHLRFGGEFSSGFAEIPLAYTTGVENVTVTGGPSLAEQTPYLPGRGAPQTFNQSREGDTLFVDWEFAPTRPGDMLVFVLEYTVEGGLWVYPDATRLEWRAIPADRSGLAVPQSRVTVTLPAPVAAEALVADAFGPAHTIEMIEAGDRTTVVYEIIEAAADGTPFQVLLDFPPELVTAVLQQWQVAEDNARLEYSIDQIDMVIEMQPDGTLHVVETQQVSVQAGILYNGVRHFSLLFTDGIQILGVREGDFPLTEMEPGSDCLDCYTVETKSPFSWWASYSPVRDEVTIDEEAAGEVRLNWFVPPLVAGESGQFALEYIVEGAVRPTETDQQLNWTAVSNYGVPIENENVRVRWLLPGGLSVEDVQFSGGDIARADDGTILITNAAPIAPNSPWQIELTLPPDATSAAVPAWQRKIEDEMAKGEIYRVRQARIDLAWLVGSLVLGIMAVLGGLTYWYLRGSRRLREAMGNYRTEPPSDLPPGVVNYLVEGKMTGRGVLASVLHLADLGLVQLQMGDPLLVTAKQQEPLAVNGQLITPAGQTVVISRFLAGLFNGLLPSLPPGTAVPLPSLLSTLPAQLPQLTKTMAEEMVGHFYGRKRGWAKMSPRLFLPVLFILFALVIANNLPARWDLPVPVVLFFGMLAWFLLSIVFSTLNSSKGSPANKEVQQWQGFKAYLVAIQQHGDLAEAQEILDHYFAYAVALGVDDRLVAQIQQMGGHIPGWLGDGSRQRPVPPMRRTWQDAWRRRLRRGSWRPQPSGSARPATTTAAPTLETISDNLTGSLERASSSLTDLLNTAVGPGQDGRSIDIVLNVAGQTVPLSWDGEQTLDGMMSDIMRKADAIRPSRPASGGGSGGYRGGSGSSRRSSSSSRPSRSRSSSSRRSGGGGRRGFK